MGIGLYEALLGFIVEWVSWEPHFNPPFIAYWLRLASGWADALFGARRI
jgi:hypothetical protein